MIMKKQNKQILYFTLLVVSLTGLAVYLYFMIKGDTKNNIIGAITCLSLSYVYLTLFIKTTNKK